MNSAAVALRPAPEPGGRQATVVPSRAAAMLGGLLDRSWSRGLLPMPGLEADALIEAAGGDDCGPGDHWREALDVLSDSLVTEAGLNPLGRTIAHGQLVAVLRSRRRAQALWRAHPEILEIPVTAPIVVLGQMRSGTTRLQRLLACDPRLDYTRFHESCHPIPPAARRPWLDTRRPRAAAALAGMALLNPGFDAIHPTSASSPDEEAGLLGFSLFGAQYEVQWRIPGFARWCENADRAPVYAEFKMLLQTLRWLRGDGTDRPWVLKVPQFTQDLDALLDVFPDARLLCLARDPGTVVASAASLVHNQMQLQSDHVDRRWIGQEWLRKVALREAAVARVLAARPEVERHRVDFAAMDADWRREIGRVYRFIRLRLTPAVEARMAAFTARSARRPAGHRYGLADFGLSAETVARALA